ncbi:MAG: transcription termination/antitermination protein NusA [Gammaproteobacteria bacterium RIFCSPLOWO2_02_FULL_42_14]|nr:MAG: transcription termination/antitermination protein NusA [Gammaproteobacteria bacterium RIFCSPHIGHO2_02_FULL_42_43]OGT27291.1 MAG: transcription termination/antitermination protein NusA [Gammaproteobacteria bacterium RIFCSPHIGHO2_01_FULL_42_8]OGT52965.1 MAG: transcription termination/antitermination protein NusA [Gammaproteobacteria bacterium RIFCSPHIGHO2_12_FULL_41_25]OGT61261.1 MAG: transcription termination/antitermination protein NusA [Gammaproteobacteria bacterium RIFCSPLOWO2_02_FULL_
MNKEMLLFIQSIADERGVEKEVIFEAVEAALAATAAKSYKENVSMRVAIDRDSGEYTTFRRWQIVPDEEVALQEFPEQVIALSKAQEINPDYVAGEFVEEPANNPELHRIGAQQAKQVMVQKVREAERAKIISQYETRIGGLMIGTVKRVTRDHLILDMGENAEGLLLREDMIPREAFRVNDRVRVFLKEVRREKRGPQLSLSRITPEFLIELFKIEVPEIGEEVITIMAAARDPGSRAKIAVKTNDGRIDPIGACVGMRGARVQAVSNELAGERIDIVLWDSNPAQLVINAMSPAEVVSIVMDEDTRTMDLVVSEEQLSQAIGRSGQNVRLASELTGWTLNVMSEKDANAKEVEQSGKSRDLFIQKLELEAAIVDLLIAEGFATLEEIAYASLDELKAIKGLEAAADDIQRRASDVLLTQELLGEVEEHQLPAADLLSVEGMTAELAGQLASHGIVTREDLAEQSVDELQELVGLDKAFAGKLIMSARAHWFN